jgi:neutral ceramidase
MRALIKLLHMKQPHKKNICLIICVLTFFFVGESAVGQGNLRVGASKINISPTPEMFKSMQNYGGLHDSLFVRSIVIDNGVVKAAFVTFDLIGVPGGDDLINTIIKELGIKPEHLIVTATHDHNAMIRASSYNEFVKEATILAVRKANSNLKPARMGFATGKAYVNVNRDQKIGEGYHMGYNPEGPSDKTVTVVSFTTLSGEPIAVYSNYPVHGVVMYLAKTKDGKPEVTGDLPGATSRYVEKQYKSAVALWTSGAAGDQNPLFMANYNQDGPDVYDEGVSGYAILDVLARRLGEEIVRLTRSIKNTSSNAILWGKKTSVTVPGRNRETPPVPGVPTQGYLATEKVKMIDGDPVTIPLSLLMINDIAFAGVSGEVFTEIGQHLKEQSIFDRTIMVTNLPMGAGYIPTDAAFLMPSEKAMTNRIKPGYVEPAIINAFLEMMNEYLKAPK